MLHKHAGKALLAGSWVNRQQGFPRPRSHTPAPVALTPMELLPASNGSTGSCTPCAHSIGKLRGSFCWQLLAAKSLPSIVPSSATADRLLAMSGRWQSSVCATMPPLEYPDSAV